MKIRGYRVEIAEVEQALSALDNVGEAVVVAREEIPGHQRTGRLRGAGPPPGSDDHGAAERPGRGAARLHGAVRLRLPGRASPDRIGKVDRRALPAPGRDRPALAIPYVAPRTSVEADVARLWADVLDLERVGVDDPFLDLGGDSLLAMRVVSRLRESFASTLRPRRSWRRGRWRRWRWPWSSTRPTPCRRRSWPGCWPGSRVSPSDDAASVLRGGRRALGARARRRVSPPTRFD